MRRSEQGSVIIYILIAVFLLAALTYAVTRSSRTGSTALTAERLSVAASEILEYGETVSNAVQKLRLRGCSDTQISLDGNILSLEHGYNYTNPSAPSDFSCHVFHANGGNINPARPPAIGWNGSGLIAWYNYNYVGNYFVEDVGDPAQRELIFYLPRLTYELCAELNARLGLGDPAIGDELTGGSTPFIGAYVTTGGDDIIGDDTNIVDGSMAGCFPYNTNSTFDFYQVLIAR